MNLKRLLSVVVAALWLSGCGSSGGPINTGLDPSKTGAQLSASEAKILCNAIQSALTDKALVRAESQVACYASARSGNPEDREACEMAASECVEDAEQNPPPEGDACTSFDNLDIDHCDATIKQIEACFGEIIDETIAAGKAASCEPPPEPGEPTEHPCDTVRENCAQVI
ncbi:MAG: hypothetical protein R3C68_04585 [Myxococcota bacterium]